MPAACVLYVEDAPQNRLLVRRLVESRDWEYREAENGQEALKQLQSEDLPDVILMDLAMPIMDGYQATELIKADSRLEHIPIVVLTAHAMPGDQERAEQAGCDYYFTKPIQTGEILDLLQQLLHPEQDLPVSSPPVPSESPAKTLRSVLEKLVLCEGSLNVDLGPAKTAFRALKQKSGFPRTSKETP